jgi:Zn-dependent protease with chaperone function
MSLRVITVAALAAAGLPCGGQVRVPNVHDLQGTAQTLSALEQKRQQCDRLRVTKVAFEEERALGGAVALAFVQKGSGLVIDLPRGASVATLQREGKLPKTEKNELNRYLNHVGKNLANVSGRPSLAWTFGVLNDAAVNAFSSPGGYVLVTRGLLQKVENEAQLAGVLAHEIAHVTERHALNVYNNVKASQCSASMVTSAVGDMVDVQSAFNQVLGSGAGFLDLDGASQKVITSLVDGVVDQIVTTGFAPDDEFTADRVALELVIQAGYNPREYIRFLGKLPEGGAVFAHHPKNAERQAALERWLAGMKPKGDEFALQDWPFDGYPSVKLPPELKAAR